MKVFLRSLRVYGKLSIIRSFRVLLQGFLMQILSPVILILVSDNLTKLYNTLHLRQYISFTLLHLLQVFTLQNLTIPYIFDRTTLKTLLNFTFQHNGNGLYEDQLDFSDVITCVCDKQGFNTVPHVLHDR